MQSKAESANRCHVCVVGEVAEQDAFRSLPGVTSDARSWQAGARIGICRNCGMTVKLLDRQWHDSVKTIYDTYTAYHQSGGAEKLSFDQSRGPVEPRSSALMRKLFSVAEVPAGADALDIGTGNGVMLRVLSQLRPDLKLWAQDLTTAQRTILEAIPGFQDLHVGEIGDLKRSFDLVTMVQVLEHVPDPRAFLIMLRPILTDRGVLVINIPDAEANPFDLLIVDHCSHFTLAHLKALAVSAGYEVAYGASDLLPRELVLIARPAGTPRDAAWPASKIDVSGYTRWLAGVEQTARALSSVGPMALFGASNAGTWLSGALTGWNGVFVDEDKNRVGNELLGHRIVSPEQVPAGTTVFVPLAEELARKIAGRLSSEAVHYVTPETMESLAPERS